MSDVIGFDVYGTLVDPLAMRGPLAEVVGPALADRAAALWRATQIDYAFRRALMDAYADFSVCTRQALVHTLRQLGIASSPKVEERLLERYLVLPAYAEVREGLVAIKRTGARLIAFSNGTEQAVRTVLENASLLASFDDVVSVDALRTYKPDPAVYRYLVRRGVAPAGHTWLVSANGWDVIGAKHAGLRAAWIARDPSAILDPWGIEPDLIVSSVADLAAHLCTSS